MILTINNNIVMGQFLKILVKIFEFLTIILPFLSKIEKEKKQDKDNSNEEEKDLDNNDFDRFNDLN